MTDPLSAHPRVELGHWPTPLQRCDRLRAEIGGPTVWLKRDDCTGLALGGNKTRKLEFLLGRAQAEAATGVVTFGALQSNHARQTAAACARLGLTCDLILTRMVARDDEHYRRSGNVLLDRLLGATVHVVDDADAAAQRFVELQEGRRLFGIVAGGSDATGVLGYVAGAVELADQAAARRLRIDRIVVAASTCGTAAGLVIGTERAGLDAVIDVACVYEPAPVTEATLHRLVAEAGAAPARWTVSDATLGDGYGVPTAEGRAAIDLLARTEGVLLDPVYTAKAFALLLARIDRGELPAEANVVFLHTGGAPGLFAYTPSL